jgi:hypothetical protein
VSTDEPLEDEILEPSDAEWEQARAHVPSLRMQLLGMLYIVAIMAGTTIGLYYATHDRAMWIIGAVVTPVVMAFTWSAMRASRFARWVARTRKGEYKGYFGLGYAAAQRAHERRMRILTEREARKPSPPDAPEG